MTNGLSFAALADPTRREVFERLARGPLPVGELAQGLPVSRPAVSQHLKAVIEPGVGGRWYGLLEDGSEGLWGDVLVWEPPGRLVLAWRITHQWGYDPNLLTEVEVRFVAVGASETRIEFEHRDLERFGDSEA